MEISLKDLPAKLTEASNTLWWNNRNTIGEDYSSGHEYVIKELNQRILVKITKNNFCTQEDRPYMKYVNSVASVTIDPNTPFSLYSSIMFYFRDLMWGNTKERVYNRAEINGIDVLYKTSL